MSTADERQIAAKRLRRMAHDSMVDVSRDIADERGYVRLVRCGHCKEFKPIRFEWFGICIRQVRERGASDPVNASDYCSHAEEMEGKIDR